MESDQDRAILSITATAQDDTQFILTSNTLGEDSNECITTKSPGREKRIPPKKPERKTIIKSQNENIDIPHTNTSHIITRDEIFAQCGDSKSESALLGPETSSNSYEKHPNENITDTICDQEADIRPKSPPKSNSKDEDKVLDKTDENCDFEFLANRFSAAVFADFDIKGVTAGESFFKCKKAPYILNQTKANEIDEKKEQPVEEYVEECVTTNRNDIEVPTIRPASNTSGFSHDSESSGRGTTDESDFNIPSKPLSSPPNDQETVRFIKTKYILKVNSIFNVFSNRA